MLLAPRYLALSLAALAVGVSSAWAAPFDARQIPADVKWVLHVDAAAARDSKLVAALLELVPEDQLADAEITLDQIDEFAGVRLDKETSGVTIFSRSFDEQDVVILLDAPVNEAVLMSFLKFNSAFATFPKGDKQIITWKDDESGKTHWGSFYDATHVLIGNDRAAVENAFDTLAGGKSLADDESFKPEIKPGGLAFLHAVEIEELVKRQDPNSPLMGLLKSTTMTLGESDGKVRLDGVLNTTSTESATQLKTLAEGARALLHFTARRAAEKDKPAVQALSRALATADLTTEQNTVRIAWPVAIETVNQAVEAVIEQKMKEEEAATRN